MRVLASLVEDGRGGVLVMETILLEAVMHDLGALRIRGAITDGFDPVETIYGDVLRLRAGEYCLIDRTN